MCEYCGCQQIAAIAELTREHDAVVALVATVREQLALRRLDDVAATCRTMLGVLRPHVRVEEEALFAAMSGEFPEHVEALAAEHREIEQVLGEADCGTPTDPAWPERLRHNLFRLREHILKEQDGLFPAAVTTLDTAQWEHLDAVRARFGSGLDAAAPIGRSQA